MSRQLSLVAVTLLMACACAGAAQQSSASVFRIIARQCGDGRPRYLSGFLVRDLDGIASGIVTALHGVVGCHDLRAEGIDGREVSLGPKLLATSVKNDLALLPSAHFPDSSPLAVGQPRWGTLDSVVLVGYPFQAALKERTIVTINHGKPSPLSSFGVDLRSLEERGSPDPSIRVLNLGGGVLPGDSGAPILDASGEVIAVADGGLRHLTEHLNWAVPLAGLVWDHDARSAAILARLALLEGRDLFDDPGVRYSRKVEFLLIGSPLERGGPYWLSRTEITNATYKECRDAGGCSNHVRAGHPTEPVLANKPQVASEVCAWLGGRLPTENEWAWAATDNQPPGDYHPDTCAMNIDQTGGQRGCVNSADVTSYLMPVASFPHNKLGLYDMFGNVWEWCVLGNGRPQRFVLRGGGAATSAKKIAPGLRAWQAPNDTKGVRCAFDGTSTTQP